MEELRQKYLERLSELYPSIATVSAEIINLQSILNLPKGTEHFLTDVHGEYEAFNHVLKNGSGSVKRKIEDVFGNTMTSKDKQTLATLIYYPKEKMEEIKQNFVKGISKYADRTMDGRESLAEAFVRYRNKEGADLVRI